MKCGFGNLLILKDNTELVCLQRSITVSHITVDYIKQVTDFYNDKAVTFRMTFGRLYPYVGAIYHQMGKPTNTV